MGADECPSSDLVAAMEDRTVTYAQGASTEAGGTPAPSVLFVQNGTGGTLSDTTLTLTGVSSQTGYFSDPPYRLAGHMPTLDFIGLWDEGGTFADNPPNADITCTVDGEAVNYVVELTSPFLCNTDDCPVDELSYSAAAVGDTVLPETPIACEGEANLFVDSCVGTVNFQCHEVGCDCRRACAGSCGGRLSGGGVEIRRITTTGSDAKELTPRVVILGRIQWGAGMASTQWHARRGARMIRKDG